MCIRDRIKAFGDCIKQGKCIGNIKDCAETVECVRYQKVKPDTIMIIFLTDLVISFLIVLRCRKAGIENYKDDTEEMNKKVREYLIEHSILTKRFAESFPNARLRVERFKKLHDERIRKEKSK